MNAELVGRLIGLVIILAFYATVGYVAVHFILKYW